MNEQVMRLVVQREQARLQKDFTTADSFRDQLSAIGISLFDKTNSWKGTDGSSGRIPTFSEVENGAGSPDAVISMMGERPTPPPLSSDTEEGQIKNKIREREEARSIKDFAKSDQIRDELKVMGVEIYDKDKIWKSSSGPCGVIIGFNAGGGSGPSPTDQEISILMMQREKSRQGSDWTTSDMIRDELKLWGVNIFDKNKTWSATDGRGGPIPQWSGPGGAQPMAAQMGQTSQMHSQHQHPQVSAITPNQAAQLNQLIAQCVANAQNPATSAQTIQFLMQAASVQPVFGQAQHFGSVAPTQTKGAKKGPQNQQPVRKADANASEDVKNALKFSRECQASGRPVGDNEIMWLVEVREKCRRDKDYSGADNLRQAYRVNLGLEMFEKEKAWQMSDGRRGEIPSWQTIV